MVPAIEIEALRVIYRHGLLARPFAALERLDLVVEKGEIFGYLGPNGAGKTTTIKCLVGLHKPTSGEARIMGTSVLDRKSRSGLGFLPEAPYFYEYLTGAEFLDFMGSLSGLTRAERRTRIPEMLDQAGLGAAGKTRLRNYSRGMRQRIGLAQAFMHRPGVAILDEPMSGLDPMGRRDVREFILRMRDTGTTILFSSHILSDVETICDHVGILNKGVLTAAGSLQEILPPGVAGSRVRVKGLKRETAEKLGARDIHGEGGVLSLSLPGDKDMENLLQAILSQKASLVSVAPEQESLEDVFMRLTGSGPEERQDEG